ncbi:MAG TPA: aminotransferase class I/II-fold pyridoxal phosphate-dependent enzyme [Ktedonobacteraceae bacterium]|nr:aminotransferase class I/II-fold pyridoxal phosphate-dependent enzyme [Ktedonobacteraceae bacterium]
MVSKRPPTLFRRNDFDPVYYDFFEKIWDGGDVYADPSGWRDTETSAADLLPTVHMDKAALGRYYLDEDTTLGNLKERILELLNSWEQRSLHWEEVTLYNSASTATAAVLIALKRLGARTVVFETPAYAVTINQAKQSSYKVVLSPTYYRDSFGLDIDRTLQRRVHPVVFWLTQPRMSLGFDQDVRHVKNLLSHLSSRDFLVVDEATEQRCPSVLHDLRSAQVLRIRGILKPMGLNGLRLACVLHSRELRVCLENAQNVLGASLDLYSLQTAAELAVKKELFFTMLSVANNQVTNLRKKAEALALGSSVRVSRLVNGYMGSVFVPLKGGKSKYAHNRKELLDYCRERRMPVILGSSMLYAFDPAWEQVRFNYFSREHHILRAMEVLATFTRGIG